MSLFVMCAQGLESLLADELSELELKDITPGFCGVYVKESSLQNIYTINYCSRLASRVLLPLLEFRCEDQQSLYNNARKISWAQFFDKQQTFAIDANVHHSSLRNSLYAAQVVKDALCDQMRESHGFRPSVDLKNPDIQLNLFIDKERAILSFDTSGQPLHKRAYRSATGEAPLKESLAAALLKLANYKGHEVIIDPCAGSGTLLIEAALIASKTSPAYLRKKFGFFSHPDFDNNLWQKVKLAADQKRVPLPAGILWGCERDEHVARLCQANIENAGFGGKITISCTNFIKHEPLVAYELCITNPPHGLRLAFDENLAELYKALGDFMKKKMAKPGRGFIFTTNSALAKKIGLATKKRHIINSSGMDARLLEFNIY